MSVDLVVFLCIRPAYLTEDPIALTLMLVLLVCCSPEETTSRYIAMTGFDHCKTYEVDEYAQHNPTPFFYQINLWCFKARISHNDRLGVFR